jgi:aminoglycoside phosphotransferase (APT) family kinase protein
MNPVRSMPAAEVDVTPELVGELLASQHPDLKDLPRELLANGWDNVIFRLGSDLLVRLPRRELAAQLVVNEQRWLPVLAPRLPLSIPAPVRIGTPAKGYPWSWSIVPLLPGHIAAQAKLANTTEAANAMGTFLRALHVPAPGDAPANAVRGIPLAARQATFASNMTALGDRPDRIDRERVQTLWQAALATPPWSGAPLWLHGDLHTANILVDQGKISGVIDFGDITAGDPATDLAVAWMLFDRAQDRAAFWTAYAQADDDTKARAKGWALAFSLIYLAHSEDNPLMTGIGRRLHATVMAPGDMAPGDMAPGDMAPGS